CIGGRAVIGLRRIERELPAGAEVERSGDGALWRPRVERPPCIAAGFEDRRLRLPEVALVLQVVGEKGRLDILSEILRRRRSEIDLAEFLAGSSRPAAVTPGTDDEKVLRALIMLLQLTINGDRAVEILLVPPAGDVQGRNGHAREVRLHRLSLPEAVVVRVCDEVRPGGQLL